MHQINNLKYIVFIFSILALSFVLPNFWEIISDDATRYPFTYYSSVNNTFCYIDISENTTLRKDVRGNNYTEAQFDSILPMFNYRQLAMDGRLPDSLKGIAIDAKKIRLHNFFFRYHPKDHFSPQIKLYTLFESFSGKVNLEMPGDFFRMTKTGIEFIKPENNMVNTVKSKTYSQILETLGYRGPAKIVAGNPSVRKAYDNGYLIVDAANTLFHLKKVNNKPFIKKIKIPQVINIAHIAPTEYGDKRFYGFAIDDKSNLYYISTKNYALVKVPVHNFDYTKDNLMIMGNMFYWNINNTHNQGKNIYAINAQSMEIMDTLSYPKKKSILSEMDQYIFPFQIKFKSDRTNYIKPHLITKGYLFVFFNIFCALILFLIFHFKRKNQCISSLLLTLFTGIFGFITSLLIDLRK